MAIRLLALGVILLSICCGTSPQAPQSQTVQTEDKVFSFVSSVGYGQPYVPGSINGLRLAYTLGATSVSYCSYDGPSDANDTIDVPISSEMTRQLSDAMSSLDLSKVHDTYYNADGGRASWTDGSSMSFTFSSATKNKQVHIDTFDFTSMPDGLALLFHICEDFRPPS